jgi:hypothetical protein
MARVWEQRRTRTGLTPNMSKAEVYSPSGAYGDIPEGVKVGAMGRTRNAAGEWERKMGMGIITSQEGCPLGAACPRGTSSPKKLTK